MSTPETTSSNPQAWVRGPKPGRPAAPGGGTSGTGAPLSAEPTLSTGRAPTTPPNAAHPPRRGPASGPDPLPGPGTGPGQAARKGSAVSALRTPPPSPGGGEAPWGEPVQRTPVRGRSRDEIGWVKAHGGAGATSLAEALGGVDVGARWPDPARGEPRRIMLVGRTSARGLRAVSRALGALRDGKAPQGVDLLGVVLVADAPGRLPLGLLRRVRVVRSVARVQRVPWIPAWRVGGRPARLPRQLSVLADLVGADGEGTEA